MWFYTTKDQNLSIQEEFYIEVLGVLMQKYKQAVLNQGKQM
jgi:hypothetical protein